MLYFAYAANLNHSHMSSLCPGAEALFSAVLENYTLTVRQWFNIEPKKGANVQGGVWYISKEHVHYLDRYEDSPELYERHAVEVVSDTGIVECLIYYMNKPFAIPLSYADPEYLRMVKQGYREWGILSEPLDNALKVVSGIWSLESRV
jgi:gamma-glutamylcyclotransferase (GGCT)/AIG2-like uncharacterized protein YtfP